MRMWRRLWHPTPVLLPGKSHGWRSLHPWGPWGREESDTTEQLHFHSHALEKEMATHSSVLAWRILGMGGAWWAALYGVAQSRTRLKWLSSSKMRMRRQSTLFLFLFTAWGHNEKGGYQQARRRNLARIWLWWHSNLGLLVYRNCEKRKFPLFQPLRPWSFVMTAW